MTRRRLCALCVCVALLALASWRRLEEGGPVESRSRSALGALAADANAARRAARAGRAGALDEALGIARELRRRAPASAATLETTFRVGVLARAAQREREARVAFHWVAEHAGASDFRGRALLELAHLERRAGALDEALGAYTAIAFDARVTSTVRDAALDWIARVHVSLGRVESARDAWRASCTHAADALARLRAYTALARSYRDDGRFEQSRDLLAEARRKHSTLLASDDERGLRARELLREASAPVVPRPAQRRLEHE
jgi:tetratricopeptide (TPR) repeat protein